MVHCEFDVAGSKERLFFRAKVGMKRKDRTWLREPDDDEDNERTVEANRRADGRKQASGKINQHTISRQIARPGNCRCTHSRLPRALSSHHRTHRHLLLLSLHFLHRVLRALGVIQAAPDEAAGD